MKKIMLPLALFFSAYAGAQSTGTFTGKPVFDIEARRNSVSLGVIRVEMFPNIAPLHVRSFDSLVSTKFYDTTAFHRVIPGFVIQGGDPNSRHGPESTWGLGDPSQPKVPAEFSTIKHVRGILSGARKANDTNSYTSQFFICVATASHLNGKYSAFGRVVSGMDVVDTIVSAPRNSADRPLQKIEMFVTRNGSNDSVPLAPALIQPTTNTTYTGMPLSIMFKWTEVPDALLYELQVDADSTFSAPFIDERVSALSLKVNALPGHVTFYWRVRANNGGHFSPWSMQPFFVFPEGTGLADVNNGREVRVYPNPTEGIVSFSNLLEGELVQIFDSAGKMVMKKTASQSTLILDLAEFADGTYQYTIRRGDNNKITGTLLLR